MLYDADKLASHMGPDAPPLEHLRSLGEGVLPDALSDGRLMAIRRACSEASMHCPPFEKLQKSLTRAVRDAIHAPRSEYEPDILKLVERFEDYDALSVTPSGSDAAWRITENNAIRDVVKRIAREARTTPEAAFPAFREAAKAALEQRERDEADRIRFEQMRVRERALEKDREILKDVRDGQSAIQMWHLRQHLEPEAGAAIDRLFERAKALTKENPMTNLVGAIHIVVRQLHSEEG